MVDPFWMKIAEAVKMVEADHSRTIKVEEGGLAAEVSILSNSVVSIMMYDVPVKPPTLIAP